MNIEEHHNYFLIGFFISEIFSYFSVIINLKHFKYLLFASSVLLVVLNGVEKIKMKMGKDKRI